MSDKEVPNQVMDRLKENGFKILRTQDSFRGFKIAAEGDIDVAKDIVDEYEYSSAAEEDGDVWVYITDHLYE